MVDFERLRRRHDEDEDVDIFAARASEDDEEDSDDDSKGESVRDRDRLREGDKTQGVLHANPQQVVENGRHVHSSAYSPLKAGNRDESSSVDQSSHMDSKPYALSSTVRASSRPIQGELERSAIDKKAAQVAAQAFDDAFAETAVEKDCQAHQSRDSDQIPSRNAAPTRSKARGEKPAGERPRRYNNRGDDRSRGQQQREQRGNAPPCASGGFVPGGGGGRYNRGRRGGGGAFSQGGPSRGGGGAGRGRQYRQKNGSYTAIPTDAPPATEDDGTLKLEADRPERASFPRYRARYYQHEDRLAEEPVDDDGLQDDERNSHRIKPFRFRADEHVPEYVESRAKATDTVREAHMAISEGNGSVSPKEKELSSRTPSNLVHSGRYKGTDTKDDGEESCDMWLHDRFEQLEAGTLPTSVFGKQGRYRGRGGRRYNRGGPRGGFSHRNRQHTAQPAHVPAAE